jgi:hypothetical protein
MDKCERWKSIDIGQSAAEFRRGKGSSTISKESTASSNTSGKQEPYGYIYLMLDPITSEVRYVGKTSRHIILRLAEHIRERPSKTNLKLVE